MSSAAISSVIIASVQSVAKVFIIGGVGWASAKYPRNAPLLPHVAISSLARVCFHTLVLPLIFGTIAQAVTYDTIGDLWFVLLAAIIVVGLSYCTATVMGYVLNVHQERPTDFQALRISAAFPNIVALPILIFPSLCEYAVVYDAFSTDHDSLTSTPEQRQQQCVATSNTMIFVYFFAWSFLFWSIGHRQLLRAANQRCVTSQDASVIEPELEPSTLLMFGIALRQTISSPGFIAMVLGFITGCITPLQKALFEPGGAIRFLGAAIETLGQASSSISTMVVAASLVPRNTTNNDTNEQLKIKEEHHSELDVAVHSTIEHEFTEASTLNDTTGTVVVSPDNKTAVTTVNESPIMSDPNFGTIHHRRKSSLVIQSIRRGSTNLVSKIRQSNPHMRKLHLWFNLSQLVLSPAIVSGLMLALECGGALASVPPMAKLVVIINSALPGALIVVVILQSDPALSETAAAVATIYLPAYLISIGTISAWTVVGLWISIPNKSGDSVCSSWR